MYDVVLSVMCAMYYVLNDFVYVQCVLEVDANVTKLYRAQNDIAVHDSFFSLCL